MVIVSLMVLSIVLVLTGIGYNIGRIADSLERIEKVVAPQIAAKE
jgi:hypothetical protein